MLRISLNRSGDSVEPAQVLILHVNPRRTETKKAPIRRFSLNWWVVQDTPRPIQGLALRVMLRISLNRSGDSVEPAQVLILHVNPRRTETKKAP